MAEKDRTSKTKAPARRILKVKLAREGKRVPNPANMQRMEYGKEYDVPDAPYWRRRIRASDVVLVGGPDVPEGTPKIHGKTEETKSDSDKTKKASDKKSGAKDK